MQTSLSHLSDTVAAGLSDIASAIEWGFTGVVWQLQQQNETLQQIDQTLKTPTATQANEWRQVAEELSNRGVFARATEFYTKALTAYPLDYRTYVGLASAYIKTSQFDRAKDVLEQSLAHAPADKEFDWKSHSYRLIGHIYACAENYQEASRVLGLAIGLSPRSAEAHYDNAQYRANTGDLASVGKSLAVAISECPRYWRTSAVSRDLRLVLPYIERIRTEFLARAQATLANEITSGRETIAVASHAVAHAMQINATLEQDPAWGAVARPLACLTTLELATSQLQVAADAPIDDYVACLDASEHAREAQSTAFRAEKMGKEQRSQLLSQFHRVRNGIRDKRNSVIINSFFTAFGLTIAAYLVGSVGGCGARINDDRSLSDSFQAFVTIGVTWAICAATLGIIFIVLRYATLEPIPGEEGAEGSPSQL